MSITMITVANFAKNGAEALHHYVEGTLPLLKQSGAKILRYGGDEALVGEEVFDLVAIMEFPSDKAMRHFLHSEDYAAMKSHRDEAFEFIKTFACKTL